jgi:hypothetical protein
MTGDAAWRDLWMAEEFCELRIGLRGRLRHRVPAKALPAMKESYRLVARCPTENRNIFHHLSVLRILDIIARGYTRSHLEKTTTCDRFFFQNTSSRQLMTTTSSFRNQLWMKDSHQSWSVRSTVALEVAAEQAFRTSAAGCWISYAAFVPTLCLFQSSTEDAPPERRRLVPRSGGAKAHAEACQTKDSAVCGAKGFGMWLRTAWALSLLFPRPGLFFAGRTRRAAPPGLVSLPSCCSFVASSAFSLLVVFVFFFVFFVPRVPVPVCSLFSQSPGR